jgi:hypothetical protein
VPGPLTGQDDGGRRDKEDQQANSDHPPRGHHDPVVHGTHCFFPLMALTATVGVQWRGWGKAGQISDVGLPVLTQKA